MEWHTQSRNELLTHIIAQRQSRGLEGQLRNPQHPASNSEFKLKFVYLPLSCLHPTSLHHAYTHLPPSCLHPPWGRGESESGLILPRSQPEMENTVLTHTLLATTWSPVWKAPQGRLESVIPRLKVRHHFTKGKKENGYWKGNRSLFTKQIQN